MAEILEKFEILITTSLGLEDALLAEAKRHKFKRAKKIAGGVLITGSWLDVYRANMNLRGAEKVLARIGEFRAFHLAQLDKRARKFPWGEYLSKDHAIKVDVSTNKKSKIYHKGAAIERIERAISETLGAPISESIEDAEIVIKVRIDDNNVVISLDTSGDGLHKRGSKMAMGKAPMRENMAALMLFEAGYKGGENVVDPMCGSGTFLIEAAEIAANLQAGRFRKFAFEKFANFDEKLLKKVRKDWRNGETDRKFYGSDRNVKVIEYANQNAERAGVQQYCNFKPHAVSNLERPIGKPGLVIVNPPYGARVGKKHDLFALYAAFGDQMREKFEGWRVCMVTSDTLLANASKLPWKPTKAPINHGGLRIKLFLTDPL